MKYGELNLGQIEAIVNKLGGMEGVKSFLSDETVVSVPAKAVTNFFPLQVNYDLSVKTVIKAGNYDWKNDDINDKNFKTSRSGQREVKLKLFYFNKKMVSKKIILEMDKQGYRPAELHELLAFGAKYPDAQKKHPIIALGSVWQGWFGDHDVPFLDLHGGGRELGLNYFGFGWSVCYRFAAVRK